MLPSGGPLTRVGFAIPFEQNSWLGGINYFRSLLLAILSMPHRKIHPVLMVGTLAREMLAKAYPGVEIVGTGLMDRKHPSRLMRRLVHKSIGHDWVLEQFLKAHRIEVWSHSGALGPRSSIATIGWIPDLQHQHYPGFFSESEIIDRDKGIRNICRYCDTVLVSSQHAKSDALSFVPDCGNRLRLLSFVSDPRPFLGKTNHHSLQLLQKQYGFAGRYFLVPNQFWTHKNHRLILQALALLKGGGVEVQVLATGNTSDARQPSHFLRLMEHAQSLGVAGNFKTLGIIPYEDLIALMRHACAIINPSLFEGWSTSVEESKSLGKQIVLSNIPVHIEQQPERAAYFDPGNAAELAAHLLRIQRDYDEDEEKREECRALALLPDRLRAYAEAYQNIVQEALASHV